MITVLVSYHARDGEREAARLAALLGARIPGLRAQAVGPDTPLSPEQLAAFASFQILFLCVIGPKWLATRGPHDRLLAFALANEMRVACIFVQDATQPPEAELPEPLRRLSRCLALTLPAAGADEDFDRLADAVGRLAYPPQAGAAPTTVQEASSPAESTTWKDRPFSKKSSLSVIAVVGAAIQRVAGMFKSRAPAREPESPPPPREPVPIVNPAPVPKSAEPLPAAPAEETKFMAEPAPVPPTPVLLGVSAPRGVKPNALFTARLAAYTKAFETAVGRKLDELGRGRAETILGAATCRWVVGTPVVVRLTGECFSAQPAEGAFEWNGEQNIVSFTVKTLPGAPEGWTVLAFEVYIAGVQVASVPLDIEINAAPQSESEHTGTATPAHTAFASYASPDRPRVMDKLSAVCACDKGLAVFTDCLDLKPGDEWQRRLAQEIPRRDLFLLFWSVNARKSSWVDWEWREALRAKGPAAIQPVPLDSPELAPPPAELSYLHFNDRYLQLRSAALATAREDRPPFTPAGG